MNAPAWSSRSIGSRLQHGIFYAIIRFLGRTPAYGLLFFVVLWYSLRPLTRSRSRPYLRRRFPEAGPFMRSMHRLRLNWNFGLTLVDRTAAGILGELRITASPDDEKALTDALSEEKGLILLTAHTGCWQTAMAGLDSLNRAVNVVMHRAPGDIDLQYFEHQGVDAPFRIIDPQGFLGGSAEMLAALQKKEILCLMGDRVFGHERNTVRVSFLGGTVRLPCAPYRLASATGAPVLVFFSRRTGPGRAVHEVAEIIRVPAGLGRRAEDCAPYAGRFAAALEAQTRIVPYQFFNFFNMWEDDDEHQGRAQAGPDRRAES